MIALVAILVADLLLVVWRPPVPFLPAVANTRTQLVYDWARGDSNMEHLAGWDEVRRTEASPRSAFDS